MDIKFWMHAPEQMLVVHLSEECEKDRARIVMLLVSAYITWSNPEEDYDDEDIIEEIYDSDCSEFIISEAQKELEYELEYTVEDADKHDADYFLDVM